MNRLSRPTALKIAAVISFSMAAVTLANIVPFITRGAASLDTSVDSPPFLIVMLAFITAIVAVVVAYGTWKQQRWGIILTIMANLVNGVSATPGILFAPNTALFIFSVVTVILSIVIGVLCLWRSPKPVMAQLRCSE